MNRPRHNLLPSQQADLADLPGVRFIEGAALAPLTTFRVGGACRGLFDCAAPDALEAAIRLLRASGKPFVLLGGGSNVLVSDRGYDGWVVRYQCEALPLEPEAAWLIPACVSLDGCARRCAETGWDGLNFCSGIPGTIGGAVAGNAGAWGRQIGDRLLFADILETDGEIRRLPPDELAFGYRTSALQQSRRVVVQAAFRLERRDPAALQREREEILRKRAARHPNIERQPCAGSIFRNLAPTSAADRRRAAGAVLEQAGAAGLRVGGASVYKKHANIIVANPGATAQDVYDLMRRMAQRVQERFGIRLEREVRLLGPFEGEGTKVSGHSLGS